MTTNTITFSEFENNVQEFSQEISLAIASSRENLERLIEDAFINDSENLADLIVLRGFGEELADSFKLSGQGIALFQIFDAELSGDFATSDELLADFLIASSTEATVDALLDYIALGTNAGIFSPLETEILSTVFEEGVQALAEGLASFTEAVATDFLNTVVSALDADSNREAFLTLNSIRELSESLDVFPALPIIDGIIDDAITLGTSRLIEFDSANFFNRLTNPNAREPGSVANAVGRLVAINTEEGFYQVDLNFFANNVAEGEPSRALDSAVILTSLLITESIAESSDEHQTTFASFNTFVPDLDLFTGSQPASLRTLAIGVDGSLGEIDLSMARNQAFIVAGNQQSIVGTDGADIIFGGLNIQGGDGADQIFVGDFNLAFVDGGAGADQIIGSEFNDLLEGGDGQDTIFGGAGDDSIRGGQGRDTLVGGAGNDTFEIIERGRDTFDGGEGIDTIDYTASEQRASLDFNALDDEGNPVVQNVEVIIGSSRNDIIENWTAPLSELVQVDENGNVERVELTFTGGEGGDRLEIGSGRFNFEGGTGRDTLEIVGNLLSERVYATFDGGTGADLLVIPKELVELAAGPTPPLPFDPGDEESIFPPETQGERGTIFLEGERSSSDAIIYDGQFLDDILRTEETLTAVLETVDEFEEPITVTVTEELNFLNFGITYYDDDFGRDLIIRLDNGIDLFIRDFENGDFGLEFTDEELLFAIPQALNPDGSSSPFRRSEDTTPERLDPAEGDSEVPIDPSDRFGPDDAQEIIDNAQDDLENGPVPAASENWTGDNTFVFEANSGESSSFSDNQIIEADPFAPFSTFEGTRQESPIDVFSEVDFSAYTAFELGDEITSDSFVFF